MILAGDIGGTNTRLALFNDRMRMVGKPQKFSTGDGKQLENYVQQVLSAPAAAGVERACLAIAGPVIDGVCRATNIGRTFVADELRESAKLKSLTLINDLVANAAGVERLDRTETVVINKGRPQRGNAAIVSPGTGLGEASMIWDGTHHRPTASEGGHSRFAPTNELECELLAHLLKKYGDTVVCEDVVSGRGLEEIFNFFVLRGESVPAALQRKLDALPERKRGAVISEAALKKQSRAAMAAMDLFVRALAVESASVVMKVMAINGLYLGGGIPPKILPLLKTKAFRQAFTTHRTMGKLLEGVPVKVILNDDTALEGAALYGLRFDA
ncbi:MAG TPA: glucokinase [Tepidisphaeraceae bacterium]|jgi:glucokinase